MLIEANRFFAITWLLVVLVAGLSLGQSLSKGLNLNTSVLALLPNNSELPAALLQADAMIEAGARDTALLVFEGAVENQTAVDSMTLLATKRLTLHSQEVAVTTRLLPNNTRPDDLVKAYGKYRFKLLDATERSAIEANPERYAHRAVTRLMSPLSMPNPLGVVEDPFGFYGHWLSRLSRGYQLGMDLDLDKSAMVKGQRYFRFLRLTASSDAFDVTASSLISEAVDRIEEEASVAGVQVMRSGLIFHAAEGATQAKAEISTIGIGSLLALVILFQWLFGGMKPIWMLMLPLATGWMVALSFTSFIYDELYVMTLVFGASLVGVAVDYILHFLCWDKKRHQLLVALVIGLVTSLIAYGSLALTPFPGLQQMACFTVIGLVATWLTVVLWLPFAGFVSRERIEHRVQWVSRTLVASSKRHWWFSATVVFCVTGFAAGAWMADSNDELRNLNTSSDKLLAQERGVAELFQVSSLSKYFVVEGRDIQQLLGREELLQAELTPLVKANQLASFEALSNYMPSLQRQRDNQEAVRKLYAESVGAFSLLTGGDADSLDMLMHAVDQNRDTWLDYAAWQTTPLSTAFAPFLTVRQDRVVSMVRLSGPINDAQLETFAELADQIEGVYFVDKSKAIEDVLREYRLALGGWLSLAYLIVGSLLLFRFRWRAVLIVVTPALATLAGFSVLGLFGQPITLFHVLASVLVLGIGLDMGVFLAESQAQGHAVLAVSASALTTLIAFGLLALSGTPVLHFFGQSSLLGILLCWLLAMALIPWYRQKER